jgi:hypothetical protein
MSAVCIGPLEGVKIVGIWPDVEKSNQAHLQLNLRRIGFEQKRP